MDYQDLAQRISGWIKEHVVSANCRGIALGLSGGIDSAVVAALARNAVGKDNVIGVIMPCHSITRDEEDALLVARHLGIEHVRVDLSSAYDHMLELMSPLTCSSETEALARANIKPRLRMITLYYTAQSRGYLVAGTGNRSELTVGYFTKYGDAGVDILPLAGLVKTQVRELARVLSIPEPIIIKAPSAGLWEGQTDEQEMGLTYDDLDRYILTGEGEPATVERIRRMQRLSEHKRVMPPRFEP